MGSFCGFGLVYRVHGLHVGGEPVGFHDREPNPADTVDSLKEHVHGLGDADGIEVDPGVGANVEVLPVDGNGLGVRYSLRDSALPINMTPITTRTTAPTISPPTSTTVPKATSKKMAVQIQSHVEGLGQLEVCR